MPLPSDPDILPSGKYIVGIDENGNEFWLQIPLNPSILVWDGNNFYWADGTDERQQVFYGTPDQEDITAVLGIQPGGRMVATIPIAGDAAIKMILVAQNGIAVWTPLDASGLPDTGFGFLVRNEEDGEASWLSTAGAIPYLDSDSVPAVIANGTNGMQLTMVGGVPTWTNPGAGSVSSGLSSIGLEGVVANRVSVESVNVKIPSFTVSDGTNDVTLVNVNVTVDFSLPNGLLGLDDGGESVSEWYYIFIVSDGTNTSAIISENISGPTMTAAPTYTYFALASVFRNDAAGNIVEYIQRGREFSTVPITWGNALNSTTALTIITSGTNLNTIVPPNTKNVSGNVGGNSTATIARSMVMASSTSGIAKQFIGSRENTGVIENFKFDAGTFYKLPIVDSSAPALYWRSNANSNQRRIEITGYEI